MILCMCPMCQLNLDAYQSRVNGHFGAEFKLPIIFFTQLMGIAFGIAPEKLGFGKEIVAAWPVIEARLSQAAVGRRLKKLLAERDRRQTWPRSWASTCVTAAATSPARSTWKEVARWAGETIDGVVVARDYKFMCSSLGQQMIEEDIKKKGLTGVVVAACSPHLHEKTFRRACENAELNPYLCQMANLREHCSWVCADKAAATAKAKALVYAAAERVKQQQPLEPMQVKVNPATLVVGGGIAGLQATLELADAGYHVYLVEHEPSASAATWPSSTRPFPPWTARPASSRRRCPRPASMRTSPS